MGITAVEESGNFLSLFIEGHHLAFQPDKLDPRIFYGSAQVLDKGADCLYFHYSQFFSQVYFDLVRVDCWDNGLGFRKNLRPQPTQDPIIVMPLEVTNPKTISFAVELRWPVLVEADKTVSVPRFADGDMSILTNGSSPNYYISEPGKVCGTVCNLGETIG